MNCHGDHDKQGHEKKHGMGKHMFIMLLCCLIPVVLLIALPFLNIENRSMYNYLSFGIFLLCPLLHGVMMFGMGKHSKKDDKFDDK